jgi:hypothetical protein
MILPFWMMGLPLTLVSSREQQKFQNLVDIFGKVVGKSNESDIPGYKG